MNKDDMVAGVISMKDMLSPIVTSLGQLRDIWLGVRNFQPQAPVSARQSTNQRVPVSESALRRRSRRRSTGERHIVTTQLNSSSRVARALQFSIIQT